MVFERRELSSTTRTFFFPSQIHSLSRSCIIVILVINLGLRLWHEFMNYQVSQWAEAGEEHYRRYPEHLYPSQHSLSFESDCVNAIGTKIQWSKPRRYDF